MDQSPSLGKSTSMAEAPRLTGTRPGYVNSLLWKMTIEIVDLPIENWDFP